MNTLVIKISLTFALATFGAALLPESPPPNQFSDCPKTLLLVDSPDGKFTFEKRYGKGKSWSAEGSEKPWYEKPVSSNEFERRVFAVHATEFFPANGVMIAGASDISSGSASVASEPASFRPTVHFSLGGLVRDHRDFSWEERPYAVVVPVGSMKKQIINLSPSDTFVLGDFSIPKGAVVLVPEGTSHTVPTGVELVKFNPSTTSLRTAVDQIIKEKGGWKLDLPTEKPGFDALVRMGGEVMDFPRVARNFVNDNPHISVGDHLFSARGFAGRLGNIEQAVNFLGKQYSEWGHAAGTPEVTFIRSFIYHHLNKLDFELKKAGFSNQSIETHQEKRKKLEGWMNLIDADLLLRRRTGGLTFAGTDKLARKLATLRNDPKKLNATIQREVLPHKLQRVKDETISSGVAAEWLTGSNPEEFKRFFSLLRTSGGMTTTESANLRSLYALNRTLRVGIETAKEEGLLDMLEANLDPLRPTSYRGSLMDAICDNLERYLDTNSTQLETALAVIQLPAMRTGFMRAYGVAIPQGQTLTLEGFLRLHPETKAAFEQPTFTGVSPLALKILKALEREDRSSWRSERMVTESFALARSKALEVEFTEENTKENSGTIERPMRSARDLGSIGIGQRITLYEQMRRGDFGEPEEIWRSLDLGAEYRSMFKSDNDFWASDQSFQQIYETLLQRKTARIVTGNQ